MSATKEVLHDQIVDGQSPTHFHTYFIKGIYNTSTDKSGWRIVGLWGEEEKGEGNRIGPSFPEDELHKCEQLMMDLHDKFGLPVEIKTVVEYLNQKKTDGHVIG